ncbi:hypothetical protein Fmac_013625 [Flemingia macrophylla]|uniref:Uncharacterized protein n=1 Tax=Flemingia macrophylla TaxID=520843 RepID=A0ABD1MTN4_9FABA
MEMWWEREYIKERMTGKSATQFVKPNQMNSRNSVGFHPKTRISARKLGARLWLFNFYNLPYSPNTKPKLPSSPPPVMLRQRKSVADSVLLSQLLRAQTSINNLKAQLKSFRKENLLWKDKFARERRRRQKLAHDLAHAKLYAKQFFVNLLQQKNKTHAIEQVCNELVLQIGQDKAMLRGLQRYCTRIRQEMEQERNMFHLAELWREESIQMKLLDAKLALQDMIHLFKQATQLSCDITKSNDVFSVFQERLIQVQPHHPSHDNPIVPSSTVRIIGFDDDCSQNNINPVLHQSTPSINEADDGCYNHSDSVAQRSSEDPWFGECEGRVATSSVKSGGIGSTFRQWEFLERQGNFADSVNPHITRGMKGCIEWPRGIPKINAKVIPLEERVRRQKSELQHILKPQG